MFERLGLEVESWVHRLEGDDISTHGVPPRVKYFRSLLLPSPSRFASRLLCWVTVVIKVIESE